MMGLDMYLMRQRSAGYWRKANAIHKWMIENICNKNYEFNCEDAVLPLEKAKELLQLCKRILSAHQNGEDWQAIAEEHLPSQGGFFYGSTDYDEGYLGDLSNTVDILEPLIPEIEASGETLVYSCWW